MTDPNHDQIVILYSEIGAWERHFNELQFKYRSAASIWLLATLSGTGFVSVADQVAFPVDKMFAIGCILMAGGLGILLFWVLDLLIYHRLLDAYFFEGRRLERTWDWLPQARINVVQGSNKNPKLGILRRTLVYYRTTMSLLLFPGAFLISLSIINLIVYTPSGSADPYLVDALTFAGVIEEKGLSWWRAGIPVMGMIAFLLLIVWLKFDSIVVDTTMNRDLAAIDKLDSASKS